MTGEKTLNKIQLESRQKEIVLFLDSKSESITPDKKDVGGHCNAPLAIIVLNPTGLWNNILRFFGRIPTLYVKNSSLWSEVRP